MSIGSKFFQLSYHIILFFLITILLISCSQNDFLYAPISKITHIPSSLAIKKISHLSLFHDYKLNYLKPSIPSSQLITINNDNKYDNIKHNLIIYNRNYKNILKKKGYYRNQTYTVKYGDTLFYIAWITGCDLHNLAQHNNISIPYRLKIGQKLHIIGNNFTKINSIITTSNKIQSSIFMSNSLKNIKSHLRTKQPVIIYSDHLHNLLHSKFLSSKVNNHLAKTTAPITTSLTVSNRTNNNTLVKSWVWPVVNGKIVNNFSTQESGNKGIDIVGLRGQPVVSAAAGKVVYTGNVLRGYGNLIIVKHNEDCLSAYAYNDTVLVQEQQEVKAGQKIATIGSTGTNSLKLHFEIRYKGKSVNPLRYLPQR
ncbi:murein hydrolase activator NlpD [Pantoea sp. Aalb]|uniref:murein hydrolase activator NlpD n=1 Tax=Pantoea sp. Aalb TaxID=2576762 RepID=UPI0013293A29|nr:murein hydrolase activator NlpD [Pantoea sp. Aalb]MXP67766.1 murein hydrolase activator NlpD [Pantoea sp. Aalb]